MTEVFLYVCAYAMCIHLWMTRTVPGWLNCQVWGRSCCCPCPRPSSPRLLWCLPAPASVQCSLQEGPTSTPFFHFLYCSWRWRVAVCSLPVTMADYCWCPSPCWPHKVVLQSTVVFERERSPVARNCQVVRDLFLIGPICSSASVSSQSFL